MISDRYQTADIDRSVALNYITRLSSCQKVMIAVMMKEEEAEEGVQEGEIKTE